MAWMRFNEPAAIPCNCCRSKALCSTEPLRREVGLVPWRVRSCCCGCCWGSPLCVESGGQRVMGRGRPSLSLFSDPPPLHSLPLSTAENPLGVGTDDLQGSDRAAPGPKGWKGGDSKQSHPALQWGAHLLTVMGSGACGGDCWSSC